MKCFQHPERPAEFSCKVCDEPLCKECRCSLGEEVYCRNCVERVMTEGGSVGHKTLSENGITKANCGRKSKFWTFVLSLVPGVGYLYLGLMKRGLQAMVTFFGAVFISNFISMEGIMALILPVLMFYTIFDSQQLVRRINAGDNVEDEELFSVNWLKIEHQWIGYGLIALGALALLNNVLPMLFDTYIFRAAIGPILIIAAGLYILSRSTRKQKGVDYEHEQD